ncbi:MAG: hypothetical protein J2P17_31860 [Mycobacterium sp.]|nr:hypothetical protein [Mycobacterium sp.]
MAGTLTRSRIEAFDQTANQLSQYAVRWRAAGRALDHAADTYVTQITNPTGTQWQGEAASSALDAAHTDRLAVTSAVMHTHEMADLAEQGSSSLLGAREGALQAIADAESEDFTVGEDLSVADNQYRSDPTEYATRMARAQAHLGYIEHHAGLLEGENQRVATQLGAGSAQMEGMTPATWRTAKGGAAGPDDTIVGDDHDKPQVRLVDDTTNGIPQLPYHEPPSARWNGPPPPGWHEGTGYWALDTDHPAEGPNPRPGPSLYQSNPPCVDPRSLTGPPTGLSPVGGHSDNPQGHYAEGFDLQGTSKVRISGTQFNGITQMVQVDGHWYQAQWQEYQYQINTIPVMQGTNDLGGLTIPDFTQFNKWQPISLGQLMQTSTNYPEATLYLPNPLKGGSIPIQGGWWAGLPSTGIPTPPVMTRGY